MTVDVDVVSVVWVVGVVIVVVVVVVVAAAAHVVIVVAHRRGKTVGFADCKPNQKKDCRQSNQSFR